MSPATKSVLVAPLDWGLGHATRCIPVIRALLERGRTVIVGGVGPHADLLKTEFPGIPSVPLVNYGISYASSPLLLMLKFPRMLMTVSARAKEEHRQLDRIVDDHAIDLVISDQRFGLTSRKARSVYITHQLCVKLPRGFAVFERLLWQGLRRAADRYDRVWIPDLPGDDSLTGELTRKFPLPPRHRFVGPLSRFSPGETTAEPPLDLLIMLSGPEPQRTTLERRLLAGLPSYRGTAVMLLGKPSDTREFDLTRRVKVRSHAPGDEIGGLLRSAKAVVCRGGYTTIMELVSLGKKAVLIPTPGQTEQEYLCRRLEQRGRFVVCRQASFDLHDALGRLEAMGDPAPVSAGGLLRDAIDEVVGD